MTSAAQLTQVIIMIGRSVTYARISLQVLSRISFVKPRHSLGAMFYRNRCYFANLPITSKYHKMELPSSFEQMKQLVQAETNPNEKCFLLERIAEIVEANPRLPRHHAQNLVIRHLQGYKNGAGRHDRIATIAYVIHRLGLKDRVRELYDQIFDRLDNDEWYVDFYEAVKALESYANYEDSPRKREVMEKIERNIGISINDVPMKYYWQVCQALVSAQRYDSPLWAKLETFVIRNVSLPHTPRMFLEVFRSFAIARQGSTQFYQLCQQVIYRGHLLNSTPSLHSPLSVLPAQGDNFALLVQTYGIVHSNTGMPLDADMLDYLYRALRAPGIKYGELGSLTKLITFMPVLGYTQSELQATIDEVVSSREIEGLSGLREIQQLYAACEARFGLVPQKIKARVQKIVDRELGRNLLPLVEGIQIVDFLVAYDGVNAGNQQLIDCLNQSIQKRYKYLSGEQIKQVRQALGQHKILSQRVNSQLLLSKNKSDSSKE